MQKKQSEALRRVMDVEESKVQYVQYCGMSVYDVCDNKCCRSGVCSEQIDSSHLRGLWYKGSI